MINNSESVNGKSASLATSLGTVYLDDIQFLKHRVKYTGKGTKDDLRTSLKMNYHDWKSVKGYDALIQTINDGFIHRTEILDGTKHVLVIDVDYYCKITKKPLDHRLTVEQIRDLPTIKKYFNFCQRSLSYSEDQQNCHLYMILDAPVDTTGSKKITKLMISLIEEDIIELLGLTPGGDYSLGIDDCMAVNSSQVVFASLHKTQIWNKNNVADTAFLLDMAQQKGVKVTGSKKRDIENKNDDLSRVPLPKSTKSPRSQKKKEVVREVIDVSITAHVLDHLYDHLFVGVLDSSAEKLYSLHDEKQQWTAYRKNLEEGEEARIEGSNFFSPTDDSKLSFMVIHTAGQLPRLWDKSGSFQRSLQSGNVSNHGTYLDYFFHVSKKVFNKYKEIEQAEDGSFPMGFFNVLVNDICNHFNIEQFDFSKFERNLTDIVTEVCEVLKEKFIFYTEKVFFTYIAESGKWEILIGKEKVFASFVYPYLIENYSSIRVFKIVSNKKVYTNLFDPDLEMIVRNLMKINSKQDLPEENIELFVFKNGVYDINTKEFTENTGQAYNREIIPWNYDPKSIDMKAVDNFKKYMNEFTGSEIKGELLYLWAMINVLRVAKRTDSIMGVVGESGKGKTTYLMFLRSLINGLSPMGNSNANGYAATLDSDLIMSGDTFALAKVEGKHVLLVQELTGNGDSKSLKFLKKLAGNGKDHTLDINPKFQQSRTIQFIAGMTFDCENIPKIPPHEKGYYRRIVNVLIGKDSPGCKEFHVKYWKLLKDKFESLFNYALTLDADQIVARFIELAGTAEIIDTVSQVRRENDSIYDLIDDFFIVTENDKDILSYEAMYRVFQAVNANGKYAHINTRKKSLKNMIIERLSDPMYEFCWYGSTSGDLIQHELIKTDVFRCKIIRDTTRGYATKLKLNSTALMAIGRHDLIQEVKDDVACKEFVNG